MIEAKYLNSCLGLKQVETVEAGPDPLNETSGSFVVNEVIFCWPVKDLVNVVKFVVNNLKFSMNLDFDFFVNVDHQVGADSAKVIGWSGGPVSSESLLYQITISLYSTKVS